MMKSEAITGTAINSELGSCGAPRRHEAVETRLARSKTVGIAILNGVEKQLEILSSAAASASRIRRRPTRRETLIDHKDPSSQPVRSGKGLRSVTAIGALLIACVLIGWCASAVVQFFGKRYELTGTAAVNAVVDRIIGVESNRRFNATSKTSSAAGAGQFIEDTWLDMIRMHRPDLAKDRTKAETLDLRREPKIAREMTTRFAERNAALLKKRGLPVTPSTVYLAHFAGGAGAVAILSAEENADAALVLAKADATGRIKREQIIKANPFLQHFSVGDLKRWADRKMHGPFLNLVELSDGSAAVRPSNPAIRSLLSSRQERRRSAEHPLAASGAP
jgi:hypothetical protein